MNFQQEIRILASHLHSNAVNINSSGLYAGKAGVALALFEAAHFLRDNEMEDVAFALLQEALISNTDDIGFENGLSGVGFALTYLIRHGLIDADFDEVFGNQYMAIAKGLNNIEKNPDELLRASKTIYFLSSLQGIGKNDAQASDIIAKLFKGMELYLSLQFFDWPNIPYVNSKTQVLQTFSAYLKLMHFSGYGHFSHSLLADYATLYRSGIVASSPAVGYYFDKAIKRHGLSQYADIANDNIVKGIRNTICNFSALPKKIDAMCMLEACGKSRDEVARLAMPPATNGIHEVMHTLCSPQAPHTYQNGMARCIFYLLGKGNTLT